MHIPEPTYNKIIACLPILCVDLLIVQEHKCLLLKRADHPAFGQLWFPGGRVHKYERLHHAAIRIAAEETGLRCGFVEIVSVEETIFLKSDGEPIDKHTVNICCKMKFNSPSSPIKLDALHEAFEWITHIRPEFHEAIRHPLMIMGFAFVSDFNPCVAQESAQEPTAPA